ncbi:MAG: FIST C-terminal domain-containing protein [Treponema sp.]|nr:FIST C-terminal domain-containing protein [Treponema sp.]
MIKTLTAQTAEVDDVKTAVEQIQSQLGTGGLLKNTIGIAACHYEFVHSGVLKGITEALPFDIVGTISSGQSAADAYGTLLFTLIVLTSDEVEFDKVLTPSLLNEPGRVIADTYTAAVRPEKPALLLTFAPFMIQNSGDEYVNVLSEASGGVPCFGTIAVDDTLDFANCFMLADGEHHRDRMAIIPVYGNIHPKFYIANISESRILEKSADVTKSAGHILMEVNGRPVTDFFEDLGLTKASETQYALSSLPFLLDYNDGTPRVSKIFVTLTPEKYAICAGAMPEGSTFWIASSDKDDVLLTTGEAVDLLLKDIKNRPGSGLLIYSCISRGMTFGGDQFREIELVREKLGSAVQPALNVPFMMAFSGGEICPTQVSDDKAINRFHNNAFIACLL